MVDFGTFIVCVLKLSITCQQRNIIANFVYFVVQKYLDNLSKIVEAAIPADFSRTNLRYKHFFTGAAAYAYHKIFCTYTPNGIAIKLPRVEINKLIESKKGFELRYFENSPVKKDYVVLDSTIVDNRKELSYWISMALDYVIVI